EAMARLRQRADSGELDPESARARLVLVGEGGERPSLEAMAAAAGLTGERPWIHFIDWRDDVENAIGLVESRRHGLVPSMDPDALASSSVAALGGPARRQACVARARAL